MGIFTMKKFLLFLLLSASLFFVSCNEENYLTGEIVEIESISFNEFYNEMRLAANPLKKSKYETIQMYNTYVYEVVESGVSTYYKADSDKEVYNKISVDEAGAKDIQAYKLNYTPNSASSKGAYCKSDVKIATFGGTSATYQWEVVNVSGYYFNRLTIKFSDGTVRVRHVAHKGWEIPVVCASNWLINQTPNPDSGGEINFELDPNEDPNEDIDLILP